MDILPAIDILDDKAVRLAKGDYNAVTVYNDDPVAQAALFKEQGARWIHVVDLDGARSGVPENIDIIERIIKETGLKIEVGGGIRSLETIDRLAEAGVSRVVLGTTLVTDPEFAKAALAKYPDMLTAGIDAKNGEVAVAGWREGAGVPAEEQTGIDASRYVEVARVFGNPVIASGGVASIEDVKNLASVADSIEGVIAGRAVYEGSLSVEEAAKLCE